MFPNYRQASSDTSFSKASNISKKALKTSFASGKFLPSKWSFILISGSFQVCELALRKWKAVSTLFNNVAW